MRQQQSLAGRWRFQIDPDGTVPLNQLAPDREIAVPLPWQAAAPRGVHPCRREAARRSSSSPVQSDERGAELVLEHLARRPAAPCRAGISYLRAAARTR